MNNYEHFEFSLEEGEEVINAFSCDDSEKNKKVYPMNDLRQVCRELAKITNMNYESLLYKAENILWGKCRKRDNDRLLLEKFMFAMMLEEEKGKI